MIFQPAFIDYWNEREEELRLRLQGRGRRYCPLHLGSASDNKANKIKPIKKVPTGPKHLKKELPEKLIMNLVP